MILDKKTIRAEYITFDFIKSRPLSKSSLHAFQKSPKHYLQYLNEKKDTSSLMLGSLVDCLVLEPETFDNRYFIYQKPDLRTKAGRQEKEDAMLAANNRILITNEDYQTAMFCKQSLLDHNESRALIEGKYNIQKRLDWINPKTGLPLVGYLDFQSETWGENFIVDLKTTKDADPDEFGKSIANFGYDLQNASYRNYFKVKKYQFPYFIFLVVETSEPFNVSVIFCDNKFNDMADESFFGTLTAFKKALEPIGNMPNHFHMGYEFRNLGTMPYFSAEIPKWKKIRFKGYDN